MPLWLKLIPWSYICIQIDFSRISLTARNSCMELPKESSGWPIQITPHSFVCNTRFAPCNVESTVDALSGKMSFCLQHLRCWSFLKNKLVASHHTIYLKDAVDWRMVYSGECPSEEINFDIWVTEFSRSAVALPPTQCVSMDYNLNGRINRVGHTSVMMPLRGQTASHHNTHELRALPVC